MGCSMQCGGTARHVFVNGGQHCPPLPQPCQAVRMFHFALLRSPFDASWMTRPACRKPARRRSLKAPAVCCSMSRTLSPSPTTVSHTTALLRLLDRGVNAAPWHAATLQQAASRLLASVSNGNCCKFIGGPLPEHSMLELARRLSSPWPLPAVLRLLCAGEGVGRRDAVREVAQAEPCSRDEAPMQAAKELKNEGADFDGFA